MQTCSTEVETDSGYRGPTCQQNPSHAHCGLPSFNLQPAVTIYLAHTSDSAEQAEYGRPVGHDGQQAIMGVTIRSLALIPLLEIQMYNLL